MLRTQVIGRVGKDATVKEINGRFVINFSLAVNERTVNPNTGEVSEETTWFNCALWRNEMSKLWEYLKKGQEVYLEGKPSYRIYKKSDNRPGLDISIKVEKVELVGSGKKDSSNGAENQDTDWTWEEEEGVANKADDKDEKFWSDPKQQEAAAKAAKNGVSEKIEEPEEIPFD